MVILIVIFIVIVIFSYYYCNRNIFYCCKMLIGGVYNVFLGRYLSDFLLMFEVFQYIIIVDVYNNELNSEFMEVGKNKGEFKKCFLILFDIKKIIRCVIVYFVKLYFFFMDFGVSFVEDEGVRFFLNFLEVY